ncbi:MAG: hypothetical protein JWR26_305 [Pedosphaera sp.]|nr:hypothetical protein [Pedosphaera sp.]
MTDEWASAPAPKPPRHWPKRLLWIGCGSLLFLVLVYFLVTSHFFLESMILPRVEEAIHAKVSVADSSISPFFKVTLEDVKVKTSLLEDPLLSVKTIRARYSLIDILRGDFNLDEITIDSPVVQIIQYADGSRNIDPMLKGMASGSTPPAKASAPAKPGKPLQIELKNFMLTNATVRLVRHSPDGTRETAEAANINLSLANLRNGRTAKGNFAMDIKTDKVPGKLRTGMPSSLLLAKFGGELECGLTADLQPTSIKARTSLDVSKAPDAYKEIAGLHAGLDCLVTPTELNGFTFSLVRNDKTLGLVKLSGPLDLLKKEGKIKLEIASIDRQLLNFIGAAYGVDFGPTTIGSTNEIELLNGGNLINITGRLNVNKLSVIQPGIATKPLDVQAEFKVAVNQTAQTALVSGFTLTGTQEQLPLLQGALTRPMKLSFGGSGSTVEESALDLTVTNFNLADWRAFIGDYAGTASLRLNVLAQQGGKKLKLDLSSAVADLAGSGAGHKIDHADITLSVQGVVDGFNKIQLDSYNVQLLHDKQQALSINGAGTYEIKGGNANLETKLDASLARLAELASMPELKASSGTVKITTHVVQKNLTPARTSNPILDQSITGNVQVENFTGQYAVSRFDRFGSSVDFDVGMKESSTEIRKLTGELTQNGKSAGSFDVSGSMDKVKLTGEFKAKVVDLNQNALAPFLAPMLGNRTLSSANININASANYNASGDSALKGEFKLADFLVSDPEKQLPGVPLTGEIRVDASMRNKVATIGECVGHIDQGDKPGGRFGATGNYDMDKKAGQLTFKLTELNQNSLRPFLASALGDKTLKSVSISSVTTANYDAHGDSSVTSEIHLSDLLMTDPGNQMPKLPIASDVNLDLTLRDGAAEIRKCAGNIQVGDLPGGNVTLSGSYDLKKQAGRAAFKLTDLNQNALGPFLTSALSDNKLTSVSINADATATYDASGASRVKGEFGIANLLVTDAAGKLPKTPLSLGLQVDAGMAAKSLNLDQLQVTWFDKAGRTQILLGGKVDMSKPGVYSGDLQLSSDSIALTPLYDLLTAPKAKTAPVASAPVQTAPASASASAQAEPAPINLPFQKFNLDVKIKQLSLREIAVRDLSTSMKLDGGQINIKPFQLVVNEAPVSATVDLNLGVPGWEYALTFAADKVPMAPIVNSLSPDQRGKVEGNLIAKAQIRGAGVTGPNLKKNLSAQVVVNTDKATIQISPQGALKHVLSAISFALGMPAVADSPLTLVNANIQIGGGVIKVSQMNLASQAFSADTGGDIRMADITGDSPLESLPVHFTLERSMAGGVTWVPGSTPANVSYVSMPDFIYLVGTLGKPDTKINKTALAGAGLKKLVGQQNTSGLNTPSVNAPSLNTPSLNTPTIANPTPTAPTVPSINTPSVTPPSVTAPSLTPPSYSVPTIRP